MLPIGDSSIIKEIIDNDGIKRVDLNVGRYMETVKDDDARKFESRPILSKLGIRILECVTSRDATRQQIQDAENVHANLGIAFDSRNPGLDAEVFDLIVREITSPNMDDVEIVTRGGKKFKNSQLTLKKTVNIDAFAKTVHHNSAWEEMGIFFDDLKNSGALEE